LTLRDPFLWGTATSAHQVEGGCTNNNWYAFEQATDGAGNPRILNRQRAGIACDHWNRYPDDIRLMKALSLNAYRFSVEWSKIEPRQGVFDESVLDHYAVMAHDLLSAGVTPMVTLQHFTTPLWFEEKGGFLAGESREIFTRFVSRVVQRLRGAVRFWCTINEPSVFAVNGYVTGEFPPGIRNMRKGIEVLVRLMQCHADAYRAIKLIQPESSVGLPLNIFILEPASRWSPVHVAGTWFANKNLHAAILRYLVDGELEMWFPFVRRIRYRAPLNGLADFVGVNYYTRFRLRFVPWRNPPVMGIAGTPEGELTDMQWEIYPEGLLRVLKFVSTFTGKPVYVTENGIADESDTKRAQFITSHLQAMRGAMKLGVNVGGYFYWTLMDNFEWAFGFAKKFGLYAVDFHTQERSLRAGSLAYPEFINRLAGNL
jgi:beta-glucosidase